MPGVISQHESDRDGGRTPGCTCREVQDRDGGCIAGRHDYPSKFKTFHKGVMLLDRIRLNVIVLGTTLKATTNKQPSIYTMHTNSNQHPEGGFSFRTDIVGKPNPDALRYLSLGRGWQWADKADAETLLTCLTKHGWAVTPGHWQDGHKSKKDGKLLEAQYILLDFDANLSWLECKQYVYFQQRALFAYTTSSHQLTSKGDRFRIVFQSDLVLTDSQSLDLLIQGLRMKVTGSDPAINSASLLFGNPTAEVHVFDLSNRIPAKELIFTAVVADEMRRQRYTRPGYQDQSYNLLQSERRVRTWLEYIPNTAYSTWLVVAGCLRAIEAQDHPWAFDAFDEWSARQYEAYDPDKVNRLWDSFSNARPGGFSKLKNLSEWFKANPDEEEYDASPKEYQSTLASNQTVTNCNQVPNQFKQRTRTNTHERNCSFSDRNT